MGGRNRRLYHGSPFHLAGLDPMTPRGHTAFNTQTAVYLTDDLWEAKLYALARDAARVNKGWGLTRHNGKAYLFLRADKWQGERGIYRLNDVGYVHCVLSREALQNPDNEHEWAILRRIVPDRVVEVRPSAALMKRVRFLNREEWEAFVATQRG